jgi:aspartyl-tRNA(Asn)/glutamyl-tRNA(Gln) amidotransferase subunit B
MLWDGAKGEVRPARSKEQSHDYRYFPEPDLPPLRLSEAWIAEQLASLPELPAARRARFASAYGLEEGEIGELIADPEISRYFEEVARGLGDPKAAANWVRGEVLAALNAERGMVPPTGLVELVGLVKAGTISNSAAKTVFDEMLKSGRPASAIVDQLGLRQVGDDGALRDWLTQAKSAHPTEFERYAAGEKKLKGVLIKYVMDLSNRRADPKRLNQLLDEV